MVKSEHDSMAEAWQLLEKAIIRYHGRPVGTIAALDSGEVALNYDQVFTRDFFVSAVAFLLHGKYEIVRNFLALTAELQTIDKSMDCFKAGRGLMPASFKVVVKDGEEELLADFGEHAIGRVAPVDSSLWWLLLVRLYLKASDDRDFVASDTIQHTIMAVLDLYLVGHFELIPTLLVPDGAFMIDRRMGMYGHPLDIEVLFFAGLRSAREALALLGSEENQHYIKEIDHRLGHLIYHLRSYYWLDQERLSFLRSGKTEEFGADAANKYNLYPENIPYWAASWLNGGAGYFAGNIGPGRMDCRFLAMGNLLAITSGLADADQRDGIVRFFIDQQSILMGRMPLKAYCPALEGEEWRLITGADPKNSPWSYHNGGSWPFLLWLVAAVTAKTGTTLLTRQDVLSYAATLQAVDWPEYFDGRDGVLVGKEARKFQVWTIAGILAAHELMKNPQKSSFLFFNDEIQGDGCPLKV